MADAMLLDSMLFVGLDIGGTNIKAGVLDGSTGELVGNPVQEPLPKQRTPEVRCTIMRTVPTKRKHVQRKMHSNHLGEKCHPPCVSFRAVCCVLSLMDKGLHPT